MTSLDRAKQFLANKAKKLAMAAVPLAALTIAAPRADATLLFSGTNCEAGGIVSLDSGSSCGVEVLPDAGNGANGIKVFGNASWSIPEGAGTGVPGNGFLRWFGGISGGSYDGTLPVYWDFSTAVTGANSNWQLQVLLNSGQVASFSDTGAGLEQGSGSVVISGSGFTTWEIRLTMNVVTTQSGSTFSINVPGNSIDLNPVASDVPEPASILLFAPGLGYMLWRRRKQQH